MVNNNCPLCEKENNNWIKLYKNIGSPEFNCSVICCKSCGHYSSKFSDHINITELYSGGNYELLDTRGSLFDKLISFDDKFIIRQLSRLKISGKKLSSSVQP
jgi:hypothetical protein